MTTEITLMVNSQEEVRSIAKYLLDVADLPSELWVKFGHEHLIYSPHKLDSEINSIITKDASKKEQM